MDGPVQIDGLLITPALLTKPGDTVLLPAS